MFFYEYYILAIKSSKFKVYYFTSMCNINYFMYVMYVYKTFGNEKNNNMYWCQYYFLEHAHGSLNVAQM